MPGRWLPQRHGLADAYTTALVAGDTSTGYGLDLDDVERILAER